MAQEVQKPRITEIQVRMDCNGCVQKIKKALHGVNGILDLYIDLPKQKITIVGWADPEKIVKAIKKTRKSAIICSHTEPEPPAQPAEPAGDGGAPPLDTENPPPSESPPPPEPTPPSEPPKDPETKSSPEAAPPPSTTESTAQPNLQPREPTRPKDVEEVHVIYHYPPDYGYGYSNYGGRSSTYPSGPAAFRREPPPLSTHVNNISHGYASHSNTYAGEPAFKPPPLYVNNTSHGYGSTYASGPSFVRPEPPSPQYATHSYNTYRPSPYVTQYEYVRPAAPPPMQFTHYSRPVPYSEDFHYQMGNNNSGNIGSVFSDENPNSCTII